MKQLVNNSSTQTCNSHGVIKIFLNGCLIAVAVRSYTKTWKVKLSVYLKHHSITSHGWVEVAFRGFFTSALDGGQWSASRLSQLTQNIMYNNDVSIGMFKCIKKAFHLLSTCLTLNIPSLARQRCLPSWGP